jgi:seryl-tRNA synthetase
MPKSNTRNTRNKSVKKTKKNTTGKKQGGWPFSNISTDIDKAIQKYKTQIEQLEQAKKVLEIKISKLETAQKTEKSIKEETEKISQLNKEKKEALTSATAGEDWFSSITKFFSQKPQPQTQAHAQA